MASYNVKKPELLKIDNFGGALFPLAEGATEITFTSSTGLTAKENITVIK